MMVIYCNDRHLNKHFDWGFVAYHGMAVELQGFGSLKVPI